jgi:DNA polymerase III epsilon subunit-like protein
MTTIARHYGYTPAQFKQLPLADRMSLIDSFREGRSKPMRFFVDLESAALLAPDQSGTSAILDLETLATSPRSIITEIGLIIFDRATLTVIDHLEIFPDFFEQLAAGRESCPETIAFHRNNGTLPNIQSPIINHQSIPCIQAVVEVAACIATHRPQNIWIQGTDFDRPIYEDFCQAQDQPLPWKYHQAKDARTTYHLAFPGQRHPKRPHKALEDCQATLADLIAALTKLNALASI